MIRDQFILDLHRELIVDNFAGGGGASTGIEMALGRHVDIAINHDPEAVALHTVNHPQTRHYCEDVFAVDPCEVTTGRPVGLAWFSPDCTHHSKARGGKPKSKKIRGLAWVTVRWAATVRPRVIALENVEEFQDWGPLLPDGQPCPVSKGKTFRHFVRELERLGYAVEWRELRACDYGAPTIRKRLFLIARCDGLPIVWPEPTHGDPTSAAVLSGRLLPWRTAAECIDWSIPCPSIFLSKEDGRKQGVKRPLVDATLRRIAKGVMRYVVDNPAPYIAPNIIPFITEHANASHQRNFPIDEPLRTLCSGVKGGHFALVAPSLIQTGYGERSGQLPRALDIQKPLGTVVGSGKHALVSAFLAKHFTGVVGSPMADPVHTVTATDHNALVAAHMLKMRGTNVGSEADTPLHTISAGGTHHALVRAFLIKYYGNEKDGISLNDPMHTVTAKDRMGLVTVAGEDWQIYDIGMRMLVPRELYRAQGFPESYIIDRGVDGPLSKTAQVRMCGNSVCPPLARAIVEANVPEIAAWFKKERRTA